MSGSKSGPSTTARPSLRLPQLRPDQWRIAQHPARIKILAMGRRWGKTVLGGCVSLATAASGGHVAWIVPTYKNGRALWRWCELATADLAATGHVHVNRSERMIEFRGGGFLGIYSADNEDSVRSEAFHLVVLDEAARMSETAWTDAIQPTLADYAGDAILISTPRGRNWFWREWIGADGSYSAAFQAPTADNPNPQIQTAAEAVRTRVPWRTYQQEWLAQFVEDGGGVFRFVQEQATADALEGPQKGSQYVVGVDWGRVTDATVFSVLDVTHKGQVYQDRMVGADYAMQRSRLQALNQRWQPTVIMAEYNSMGGPLVEQLQRDGLPVQAFTTTNATKRVLIDGLSLAFENRGLRILNDPVLVGELQAYESETLASGMIRYGAPGGVHDDCVMALALAWYAATSTPSGQLMY